jgi:hypothetical protein
VHIQVTKKCVVHHEKIRTNGEYLDV